MPYFWYNFIILFRLALFGFALVKFFIRTGNVPYYDKTAAFAMARTMEVWQWGRWLLTYGFLIATYPVLSLIFWCSPWLVGFTLPDFSPSRRRIRRICHRKMISRGFCLERAFDARLMVLSCYQLNATWSMILTSFRKWSLGFAAAIAQIQTVSVRTDAFCKNYGLLWPPDGPLLTMILGCLSVLSVSIVAIPPLLQFSICSFVASCNLSWKNSKLGLAMALDRARAFWSIKCRRRHENHLSVHLSIALSSDTVLEEAKRASWEPNSVQAVIDNCANTHVWTREEDFVASSLEYFGENNPYGIITIGDHKEVPKARGTVPVTWKDSGGRVHSKVLEDCFLMPTSPVNIVSISRLAETLGDEEGTWIKTRWKSSIFTWEFGKYSMEIPHPLGQIPTLSFQVGLKNYLSFTTLCKSVGAQHDTTRPIACHTILPEERFPHTCLRNERRHDFLDALVPDTHHIGDEEIDVGDSLIYKQGSTHSKANVQSLRKDPETDVQYVSVELEDGHVEEVTHDNLFLSSATDLADVPFSIDALRLHSKHLDEDVLEALANPPEQTPLLREFYSWHHRLGHLSFKRMFALSEHGYLPRRFLKLTNEKLLCPSCVFGNCKKRPWRAKGMLNHIRKETDSCPGARVSIDHVISAQPGLIPRVDGRHTRDRITCGCVFLDHASGHSYTHMQTACTNEESVAAKKEYERIAHSNGVSIKSYHADNGIFAEKAFRDEVAACNQDITYCAVGAHHQNGIIERHIGELTAGARTNLLHAQRRWPDAISSILWPFAWKDYERRLNHFRLDDAGRSPEMKFSNSEFRVRLKDFHPFGCPVFVLEASLQSDGFHPKWEPRARCGIYLGHSPCHAGSVALVLNPKTLHVSPQFHVVFDDDFTTVPYMANGTIPPHWKELVEHSRTLATEEDINLATSCANVEIDKEQTAVAEEGDHLLPNSSRSISFADNLLAETITPTRVSEEARVSQTSEEEHPPADTPTDTTSSEEDVSFTPDSAVPPVNPQQNSTVENPLTAPSLANLDELSARRSQRVRKATDKAANSSSSMVKRLFGLFVAVSSVFMAVELPSPSTMAGKVVAHAHQVNLHFDGTMNEIHHMALATAKGTNDTYTLKQMLKEPDVADFCTAMMKEVDDHESRGHWTLMDRAELDPSIKTILSIWSFKRKRYPDGRILKHKARLCAHGGMQTWGENYWETYSPVVNWMSVRTLLVLSKIYDLDTRSIDFVLAFPQADLDVDVYMELPYGFRGPDSSKRYVLKLNKNLYGLKQASYNWFELLKSGLEARGYVNQSNADRCVFFGKNAIILVYVDDCLIFEKKGSNAADTLIKELKDGPENFDFTDEGDITKYLGVDVKKHPNGTYELTQKHLIQRFLEVVGMSDDTNSRKTPVIKPLLHKDIEGLPRKHEWNYRQAIGMLTYLQGTSRPDISMAVHQAARFTICPKLTHERAVYRIAKYLKGTSDKGIIFRPDKTGLECFVDADFAGGWNQADSNNAEAVMSRTGYVIMYAGCPLLWCSKLQTEIALSTTEAEYIALSQAMREVLPMMTLLKEINKIFPIGFKTPRIHCKVWEDNESCIKVAKNENFTPRTKHIAIKYHHFRSYVQDGTIQVLSIDTKEQTADIFTKPLDESLFIHLRLKLCGW